MEVAQLNYDIAKTNAFAAKEKAKLKLKTKARLNTN